MSTYIPLELLLMFFHKSRLRFSRNFWQEKSTYVPLFQSKQSSKRHFLPLHRSFLATYMHCTHLNLIALLLISFFARWPTALLVPMMWMMMRWCRKKLVILLLVIWTLTLFAVAPRRIGIETLISVLTSAALQRRTFPWFEWFLFISVAWSSSPFDGMPSTALLLLRYRAVKCLYIAGASSAGRTRLCLCIDPERRDPANAMGAASYEDAPQQHDERNKVDQTRSIKAN